MRLFVTTPCTILSYIVHPPRLGYFFKPFWTQDIPCCSSLVYCGTKIPGQRHGGINFDRQSSSSQPDFNPLQAREKWQAHEAEFESRDYFSDVWDNFLARLAHAGTYWIPEYGWWDIDNDELEVPYQIEVTRLFLEHCWEQGQPWNSFE